jgi:integrase
MKKAYRLYQRQNGVFYLENNGTGEQRSLKTRDKEKAGKLLKAENESREQSALNLELGKVYLKAADPFMAKRGWQMVMDELSSHGIDESRTRCQRAMQSKPFDQIRSKLLVETTAEDLKAVLKRGGAATANYLRRLHNLALGNGWIPSCILPPKQWPRTAPKPKKAITLAEHKKIIENEANPERWFYYQMLWITGAAQSDCAGFSDKNIDWTEKVFSYKRKKTGVWCFLEIGQELEALLSGLPQNGYLFPKIALLSANDRASEFSRRSRCAAVKGVTLHSYRYGWAERAYELGYDERFAQAALGHKSRAVHHAYARKARVVCPALKALESPVLLVADKKDGNYT